MGFDLEMVWVIKGGLGQLDFFFFFLGLGLTAMMLQTDRYLL